MNEKVYTKLTDNGKLNHDDCYIYLFCVVLNPSTVRKDRNMQSYITRNFKILNF